MHIQRPAVSDPGWIKTIECSRCLALLRVAHANIFKGIFIENHKERRRISINFICEACGEENMIASCANSSKAHPFDVFPWRPEASSQSSTP